MIFLFDYKYSKSPNEDCNVLCLNKSGRSHGASFILISLLSSWGWRAPIRALYMFSEIFLDPCRHVESALVYRKFQPPTSTSSCTLARVAASFRERLCSVTDSDVIIRRDLLFLDGLSGSRSSLVGGPRRGCSASTPAVPRCTHSPLDDTWRPKPTSRNGRRRCMFAP